MRPVHRAAALAVLLCSHLDSFSQSPLTVEKIMRDPKWIGTQPSGIQWGGDGKTIYFNWNPDMELDDSLYYITLNDRTPRKATVQQKQGRINANSLQWNDNRDAYVYTSLGDVWYTEVKSGRTRRITNTIDLESNPRFTFSGKSVAFYRSQNLYAWDIATGETVQLTNIKAADAPAGPGRREGGSSTTSVQDEWLKKDQLQWFQVLRERKTKKDAEDKYNKNAREKELRAIPLGDRSVQNLLISPDGRFISYALFKPGNSKSTFVPDYVTESGYTVNLPARPKVGTESGISSLYIFDRVKDTILEIKTDSLPGIADMPAYYKDYPSRYAELTKKSLNRPVGISIAQWSPNGNYLLLDIRARDNKDRWLAAWDATLGKLLVIDRQHDDAWIGGPGMFASLGWIDDATCWFQSEATGYSQLYAYNMTTSSKRALTSGNFEIQQARLSRDKKHFYISTNEVHPGEQHFYKLNIASGKREQLTSGVGAHQVQLSPDEKWLAILYSNATNPWELFIQENKANAKPQQITRLSKSDEFNTYAWRQPELITIPAADGQPVYARVYKPKDLKPGAPLVFFVHGAGYLQNAHRWWSSYFREFMFNNLLADEGYVVMDIDYRGSAGYGRDWRTGIYRHMGGKDLSDHVDAVKYAVKEFGVNPKRVGLYGGSYGGFITLMGLFTEPDVFASGASLRPVTDWAQYNHPYTANILNEPERDSIAYRRSSPMYFAEGLKGDLLICHGMVDVNVHYQDAVKLTQRLIELGKDSWELASYPMEDHGFVEPSSWTDEYKRIHKLFRRTLWP